jgi:hypothetical protein
MKTARIKANAETIVSANTPHFITENLEVMDLFLAEFQNKSFKFWI